MGPPSEQNIDLSAGLAAIREMFLHAETGEDRERIARSLLGGCLALFPASGASLILKDKPAVKYFLTRNHVTNGPEALGYETLAGVRGLAGQALKESRAGVADLGKIERTYDRASDGIPGVQDPAMVLVAPLEEESRTTGCVVLLFAREIADAEGALVWLSHLCATGSLALHQRTSFERLRKLSTTDDLTGAYNYRHLLDSLGREIRRAGRFEQVFSVIMLDVDHLKEYNDLHGHLAGSRLLASFAQIVQERLRAVDTMAKYGGDEFVVILPQTTKQGSGVVAERIRSAIERHRFPGEERKITTSLGIASYPEDGDRVEALLARADEALYRAKNTGRNRVCIVGTDDENRK